MMVVIEGKRSLCLARNQLAILQDPAFKRPPKPQQQQQQQQQQQIRQPH